MRSAIGTSSAQRPLLAGDRGKLLVKAAASKQPPYFLSTGVVVFFLFKKTGYTVMATCGIEYDKIQTIGHSPLCEDQGLGGVACGEGAGMALNSAFQPDHNVASSNENVRDVFEWGYGRFLLLLFSFIPSWQTEEPESMRFWVLLLLFFFSQARGNRGARISKILAPPFAFLLQPSPGNQRSQNL